MTPELWVALAVFALVATATPGPNNIMLMASGANFGIRATFPHMAGIALGFSVMIALVGLGLMRLFDLWPSSYVILKTLSLAYIVWLAWKIANSAAPGSGRARSAPLTFWQAAAFQWVNPKAWAMALTAIGLYAAARTPASVLVVAATFALVALPSVAGWTWAGRQMGRVLTDPSRLRVFNWAMAALLLLSGVPALLA